MNILALEPYYGGSHKAFLDGLVNHSQHNIKTITMAGRFWKWRMHGSSVTLSNKARTMFNEGFKPDLILATDMVNVPAFLALTRDIFSELPVILYFHENQLTYPVREGEKVDLTYAFINYLSCLASDKVVFNSAFHRDQFLSALPGMLKNYTDYTHLQTTQEIRRRSSVLHLGMKLNEHDENRPEPETRTGWRGPNNLPTVLWNHRWEYDKKPDVFFRMMNRIDDAGFRFQLILAGKHFKEKPPEFERAFSRYAERILHYGYAEDFAEYTRLLHASDIVVSTSIHEFFGLAIMEAIYCGCHPVLPNRLSYPELIPDSLHDPLLHSPILYDNEDELFELLCNLINKKQKPLPVKSLKSVVKHLEWSQHHKAYDDLFDESLAVKLASKS